MKIGLDNRNVIITGASSGIGAATAVACARAGMDCLINGRDADRLERVAAEVQRLGRRVVCVVGDVTEPGLNHRLLDTAEQDLGGYYAVFANAGYGYKKPAHLLGLDELRRKFDVNFFASVELVTEAARRLAAARKPGHLLMCSSALAKFTMINFSAYSATKAAQHHVCRAMRMELRGQGIHVSSVHPITTRTDFFVRGDEYAGRPTDPEHAFDHVPRWMLQRPEQVADAVVRCLRRPRPEVWTSTLAPMAAAVMCIWPRFMDVIGKKG